MDSRHHRKWKCSHLDCVFVHKNCCILVLLTCCHHSFAVPPVVINSIIIQAGNVELNPGPSPKYPCGECKKARTSYRGAKASILCDSCDTWFHTECVQISDSMLSILGHSDMPWECSNCGQPNLSPDLFDSLLVDGTFKSINANLDTLDFSHLVHPWLSLHCQKHLGTVIRGPHSVLFQSIYPRKDELACLVHATKPDIIIGSETWFKPSMGLGDFFPTDYCLYRKDRKDGYGGVLLGIHTSLNSHEITPESEAELVAAKIISSKQTLVIGSMYRPPYNNQEHMDELNCAILELCQSNPNTAVWIAGGANLPDINWSMETVNTHQYRQQINGSFSQNFAQSRLEQVDFST